MIIVLGGQISGEGSSEQIFYFLLNEYAYLHSFFLELDENITTLSLSGRYEATTSYLLAE